VSVRRMIDVSEICRPSGESAAPLDATRQGDPERPTDPNLERILTGRAG
jgi:hypothetical protein